MLMGRQMEKATKRTGKREKPLEFAALGKRLRSARRQRKMRLKDVAEMVGCSESMLSNIECDRVQPSLQMLHRISTVLDTSIGNQIGRASCRERVCQYV